MPTDPNRSITPQQPCYVCESPTRTACARCKRPICTDHTKSHAQMHWETWRAGGSRASTKWTRYMPSGILLKVCPECDAALRAKEAPDLARDRVLVRKKVLRNLLVLAIPFAVILVPFLLGRFVCH